MVWLERLLDFIKQSWDVISPIVIVNPYTGGVILRLGSYNRNLKVGLNWKLPVFESPITITTCTDTLNLESQLLVTKDEVNITLDSIIKYNVNDVRKATLEIFGPSEALQDITYATIKAEVLKRTWEECRSEELDKRVTEVVRRDAAKWGMYIQSVRLASMQLVGEQQIGNAIRYAADILAKAIGGKP